MKSSEDFTLDRGRKDGRNPYCRSCTRETNRIAYHANLPRESARKANAYRANPEKFLTRNRRWRDANRETERAQHRAYHQTHKAGAVKRAGKRRALIKKAAFIPFTANQLAARWAYYGGKCWICGTRATVSDHVKPIAKGGAHMLSNIRPACVPCNSAKRDRWPFSILIPSSSVQVSIPLKPQAS